VQGPIAIQEYMLTQQGSTLLMQLQIQIAKELLISVPQKYRTYTVPQVPVHQSQYARRATKRLFEDPQCP